MRSGKTVAVNELHPLGRLIQAAQDREGWSTRDMEKQAERNGYSMKHSNFSRLKIEPVVAIKASQIQVLASVLGVSEQAVAFAAVESMGVNLDTQAATLEDSLRYTTDLSTRDQRLVLSLVTAMRGEKSGTSGQQGKPRTDTGSTARRLAPAGDSRPGQKTEPEYNITELHGHEARSIPVPPREQLAAHPKVKTTREKLDESTGEGDDQSNHRNDA